MQAQQAFSGTGMTRMALADERRAELIDGTQWAFDLNWDEILTFCQFSHSYRAPQGTVVFSEGDAERFMCLISEGSVAVCKEDEHHSSQVIATIGNGKMIGEMALIDGEPRSATAVTAEPCCLHVLSEENFRRLREQHPRLWGKLLWKIAKLMSQRLRLTSGQLVDHLSAVHD